MTSIWNRAHEWVRAQVYIWLWYERLDRNEYRCQQGYVNTIILCCWANSRVRQWLVEDDTSLVWSSCTLQSLHCTSRFAYLRSCLSDMFEIVWFVWSVLEILNWSPSDWTLAPMSSSSPPHPQNRFEKPFNCLGTVQDGYNHDICRVSKSPELVWSHCYSPPKYQFVGQLIFELIHCHRHVPWVWSAS